MNPSLIATIVAVELVAGFLLMCLLSAARSDD